jgi:hypothetical protein
MATIRCPHCTLPITEAEARTGKCPWCDKDFGPEKQSKDQDSDSAPAAPPKKLGFLALFGILFVGGVLFALVDAGLRGFRSGTGGIGAGAGVALTYGILHGVGRVAKKK